MTELDRAYFFRSWTSQHGHQRLLPAFLTTPGAQRSVQIIAAPELSETPAMPLLEQLAARCMWTPASHSAEMGTVSMPSTELLTGIGQEHWMALPFPVDPLTGFIGVLCGRVPTPPADLMKTVLSLYVNLLIFFWTTYALWRLAGMHLPPIGVRLELILWFLGIAATPGVLVWGASVRLQADLTFNLEHAARSELIEHLQKIENGVSRIHLQSLKVCRSIVQEPGLHQFLSGLESLPQDQRTNKFNDYFSRLDKQLQQSNLDVLAILLYGPGNGAGYFSPRAQYSAATINMMDEFHLAFSLELLRRRFPGFVTEEKRLGVSRKSSINAFISHGIGGTNQELFEALDTLTPFRSAGRQLLRYHNLIMPAGATSSREIAPYMMIILWDQNPGFHRYLAEATMEANRLQAAQGNKATIRTIALYSGPDGFKRVSRDAPHPEYAHLARKARDGGFLGISGNWMHGGFASTRMPGFFLAACSSLDFIDDHVRAEARGLYTSLFLLLVFLLATGQALSVWLGSPIVRMTEGLSRVCRKDLNVQVAESRHDELGKAGAYLDEMIGSLRERQAISRFVAPQVLEVVGHGDFHEACRPQTREVVLLVSDVRSFTTMSESHPPAEIFALINRHLQVMTRIIQRHGGAIDRFIGDAIQAVFYPGPGESMVRRALRAADEMMMAHHGIIAERQRSGLFSYGIGVGLEMGEVVTGVLGDREFRLDFTVLGEPLKHAADLEGASKKGKARLVICSEQIRRRAGPGFEFIPLDDPETPNAWELVSADSAASDVVPDDSLIKSTSATSRVTIVQESASSVSAKASSTAVTSSARSAPVVSHAPSSSGNISSVKPEVRWSAGVVAAILILLFFPVFLLLPPIFSLQQSRQLNQERSTAEALQEDQALMTKMSEPKSLAAALFRSLGRELQSILSRQIDTEESVEQFRSRVAPSLRRLFPHSAFRVVTYAPAPVRYQQTVDLINRVIARTLHPFWIPHFMCVFSPERVSATLHEITGQIPVCSDQHVRDIGACLGAHVRGVYDQYLYHHLGKHLDRSGFGYPRRLWQDALGMLVESELEKERLLFSWYPVYAASTAHLLEEPCRLPESEPERMELIKQGLRASLLIFLAPDDLNERILKPALQRLLADRGSHLRFPSDILSSSTPSVDVPPEIDLGYFDRVLTTAGELMIHSPEPYCINRPVPHSTSAATWWPLLIPALMFIWLALVVHFIIAPIRRQAPVNLTLLGQMAVVFYLIIAPALSLALLTLERSAVEHQSQVEGRTRLDLLRMLKTIDDSQKMYLGWTLAEVDNIMEASRTRQLIVRANNAKSQQLEIIGDTLIQYIFELGLHRGVWLPRIFLLGLGGGSTSFSNRSDIAPIVARTLQQVTLPALKRLYSDRGSGSVRDQAADLAVGAGVEEMRLLVSTIFPGDMLADMANGPRSLSNFVFADEQFLFFKKLLKIADTPRGILQLQLKTESIDVHNLRAWSRHARTASDSESSRFSFWCGLRRAPFIYSPFPYLRLTPDPDDIVEIDATEAPQAVTVGEIAALAIRTEGPVWHERGTAQERELLLAQPGQTMNDSVLSGAAPIGRFLVEEQTQLVSPRQRLMLFLLFLTFLLALTVSRQFVRPIIQLTQNAHAITCGRFSVRMEAVGAREFVELAHAFNHMARGVEEGRLLSRFVSEAVRSAAADDARNRAAEKGELIEVSVIFAGLADFKKVLEQQSPQEVVVLLNRFLEAMSQEIRAHGGDIDKFIGEKILAVFHPTRFGGAEKAAAAAVQAAEGMRRRIRTLAPELVQPLGVGVVTGPVLAGIMGTDDVRLEYTVIGDTVNLASRLGDLALKISPQRQILKSYEGSVGGIVIESRTHALLCSDSTTGFSGRLLRLQLPPIKGKTRSVEAYVVAEA